MDVDGFQSALTAYRRGETATHQRAVPARRPGADYRGPLRALTIARYTVRTSTGTSSWGRAAAALASSSARSFPGRPQWEDTHCRCSCRPVDANSGRLLQMETPSGEDCADGPRCSLLIDDCESVHHCESQHHWVLGVGRLVLLVLFLFEFYPFVLVYVCVF